VQSQNANATSQLQLSDERTFSRICVTWRGQAAVKSSHGGGRWLGGREEIVAEGAATASTVVVAAILDPRNGQGPISYVIFAVSAAAKRIQIGNFFDTVN